MQLKEFLEVCRDSNIIIYDRKNNRIISGSIYADVSPYLSYRVLDISTRGYDNISITINYSSDMGAQNEETSY